MAPPTPGADDTVDGVSPDSFKDAAKDGWEKGKAKWGSQRRLKVVEQWVEGTNPITQYGLTMKKVN
jgi:hypothetical protein